MNRSIWIIFAFAATGLFSSGCDDYAPAMARDNIHKSFRVEAGGNLTLESDAGSVEVASGGGDEVRVDISREIRGASETQAQSDLQEWLVDFRQDGNDVHIRSKRPGNGFGRSNWWNRIRVHYVITVPDKYNLDLKTAGGNIHVMDLEGSVLAHTSGGSLHFGYIKGKVNAETSGGSITVEGGSGPMEVETSGGSIQIGRVNGPITAQTSGGSITVDEVQGRIVASTSGGRIEANITRQPEGDCELSTSGGPIHARLSKDLNLDISAETSGGSVHANIPVMVKGRVGGNSLEGKLNQGGPRLALHTSGGSISIDEIQ